MPESKLQDALLSVSQAAAALGLREVTIRKWIAARRIAYVRLGRRAVRVSESEVQRLRLAGTVPARPGS